MMSRVFLIIYLILLAIVAFALLTDQKGLFSLSTETDSMKTFLWLIGGTIVCLILPPLIIVWLLAKAIYKRKLLQITLTGIILALICLSLAITLQKSASSDLQKIFIYVSIISNPVIILTLLLLDIFFWQKQKLPS